MLISTNVITKAEKTMSTAQRKAFNRFGFTIADTEQSLKNVVSVIKKTSELTLKNFSTQSSLYKEAAKTNGNPLPYRQFLAILPDNQMKDLNNFMSTTIKMR